MEGFEHIAVAEMPEEPKKEEPPKEEMPKMENGLENGTPTFDQVIEQGIENALNAVEKQYGDLPFHNREHSENVLKRTERILTIVHEKNPDIVTPRHILLGKFAAAFHDRFQISESVSTVDPETGLTKTMRVRAIQANEGVSAYDAIQFMDRINEMQQPDLFSAEDMKIVSEALQATTPGFNPEKKTVVQPFLKSDASFISRALALADLGDAGMDGADAFVAAGANLFREENLDVEEAIKKATASENPEPLTDKQKEFFKKRMLAWGSFQPSFAQGRADLFEQEITQFPEETKEALRAEFSHFPESIMAAQKKVENRSHMSFEELARDFGYKI